MKYPKGTSVKVFEGSTLVENFRLRSDCRCKTSVRKLVYRTYPHLDHSKITLIIEE